jgi:hypothetical protein
MTIQEHIRLYTYDLPSPSDVVDLKEVHKMKFYHTSYREYLCVQGDYIIGVYPFAIKVERVFDNDGGANTYDRFKTLGVRSMYNHNDFDKGLIDMDPCDIFEKVSGIKIHHDESDDHLRIINHSNDISGFDAEVLSYRRDKRLNELGI